PCPRSPNRPPAPPTRRTGIPARSTGTTCRTTTPNSRTNGRRRRRGPAASGGACPESSATCHDRREDDAPVSASLVTLVGNPRPGSRTLQVAVEAAAAVAGRIGHRELNGHDGSADV